MPKCRAVSASRGGRTSKQAAAAATSQVHYHQPTSQPSSQPKHQQSNHDHGRRSVGPNLFILPHETQQRVLGIDIASAFG